jgi:Na+-transporting NADH:ubiquinone oxidoreductase subunit NqrD
MRKALLALAILAAPRAALACPVCFGQSDAPMAVATNMGIWMMLGVVVVVLAAFASFFVYLMRRAKLVAASEQPDPAGAGRYM